MLGRSRARCSRFMYLGHSDYCDLLFSSKLRDILCSTFEYVIYIITIFVAGDSRGLGSGRLMIMSKE